MNKATVDEHRWVIQLRRTLDEDPEDDDNGGTPITIFGVPKALMSTSPDSYTPQLVALGPYHRWRQGLYEMERYKLAAAKRAQRHFLPPHKLQTLVDHLMQAEQIIRGHYHKFLTFNGETLAWMMALDACFLLEFLQIYAVREGKLLNRASSRLSHLVDSAGRKSAYSTFLRDVVMLENQVPLFVLRKVLELQSDSIKSTNELIGSMLRGFCKELFPFRMTEEALPAQEGPEASDAHHLLDLLYHMIVPKAERLESEIILIDDPQVPNEEKNDGVSEKPSYVMKLLKEMWKLISKLNSSPARFVKRLFSFLLKLPWTIITRLPGVSILARQVLSILCLPRGKDADESEKDENCSLKPPLIEEIAIPSVTQLAKSGICFAPATGGISTINFDPRTITLCLPTVTLDVNSEVVFRNLVAYEAASVSGPLILTRYTELMNGIIDTEDDVKLLRERGILLNHLNSDREVANSWNGMSKSIRLTRVPVLDKVIEDVNKYYNKRWKVRAGKFMKRYVYGSWQVLTMLATVMLLLLVSLQAFCSVYDCTQTFHVWNNS